MSLTLESASLSHIGLVREKNEDAFQVHPEKQLYILADGMGGHRAGDVASKEAIAKLIELIADSFDGDTDIVTALDLMEQSFATVNAHVHSLGRNTPHLAGMGTTLCALLFLDEGMVMGHVGDSRIYRLRQGAMEAMTEDHSLVRELLNAGSLTEDEVSSFPRKHVITRAIGIDPYVDPTICLVDTRHGDLYLMCSDGLTDGVPNDEIETILKKPNPLDSIARDLVDAAMDHGGNDNVTVVLVRVSTDNERNNLPG